MKNKNNKLLIGLTIFLFACLTPEKNDRLEIYGYSPGDSLSDDFKVISMYGYFFSKAELTRDKRVTIYMINNYITLINFSKLTSDEHDKYKELITQKLQIRPKHYKGITPYGVKVKDEMFYWKDTLSGYEATLSWNTENDTVLSYLSISNKTISDSLKDLYIPVDTTEIEIVEY